ncbi:PhzF family phenazine biosynthesis protein [Microbispora sp. ATCC PTA-5024]|uniref:PhzF family phenazine biosynthesis protein n=1 Tax=Microbispora sp. ATCC PTA-5024 TaxID=316330 RepID=UPI0003DBD9A8|nr:PhzF family phenazine biosynthesis isomerase [Microbispora sp. ATCC PTA-5024]ETK33352.1 phenazine biosynthesis protein PhzF [Microbispora sp. ATCC PTA-5024]
MKVLQYSAFSTHSSGGNPAGVVLDATGADDASLLATAAELGFSETAFVVPCGDGSLNIRYFSPLMEVPFCGHATIATAVAYAERYGVGTLLLRTKAGEVPVTTSITAEGSIVATLVSVTPHSIAISDTDLRELLAALRWSPDDLEPCLPPRVAYAGAWHPVIGAATRARLADLDYDMPTLKSLMTHNDWATIDLVWRESPTVYHCRNPFPPGGIVEDPATGAAAAAFGGYLRELELITAPVSITIHQGHDMGRPSLIKVTIPDGRENGISVTGTAIQMRAD